MDDKEIVEQLARGGEEGYALLIDRYVRYVGAVIAGIAKGCLTAEDMEELAADVFFSIWKKRDTLRAESLRGYIAKAARNATFSRLRKNGMNAVPYEEDILAAAPGDAPDELAIRREQTRLLEQAVREFGEPDRSIFIRFYYFGETIGGIAAKLDLPPGTAKSKLHRARQKLRELFMERGYGRG